MIDVGLLPLPVEEAIGKDGLPLPQHPGKVLFESGDAAGIKHPLQPPGEGLAHDGVRLCAELGQVFAVAQQHLAALVPHDDGVGQALPQRPDEPDMGLQLLAGSLLGASR